MGTWNTRINSNDTFQNIYQVFFELYNDGHEPLYISNQIQKDYSEMFEDSDDRSNCLFGLALAQWETKSLDKMLFDKVKEIIETGDDLKVWKALGADSKTIKQRELNLNKFLNQLCIEKEKSKRRVKQKFIYSAINLLTLPAPDGKKVFSIIESYGNGEYSSTSSSLSYGSIGGSVFYFYTKGKFIDANWLDNQTLEIKHDKTITFAMKNESTFYSGDELRIIYTEM